LLPGKFEGASATYDAEAFALGACTGHLLELGFDFVAVVCTLMGKDAAGIFSGSDDALAGEFGGAVAGELAVEGVVAGFAGGAAFTVKIVVLDDADKLPGVALGVSFGRAGDVGELAAVEFFSGDGGGGQEEVGAGQSRKNDES
jgi:hypothetical protein